MCKLDRITGGEDILSGRANCGLRIRGGFNIRYRVGIDKLSKPVFVGIVRNTSYLADQGAQSRTCIDAIRVQKIGD